MLDLERGGAGYRTLGRMTGMKSARIGLALALALMVGVAGAPRVLGQGMGGGNMMRHHYAMRHGIPMPYAEMSNPLAADAGTIAGGGRLFAEHCVTCHGAKGLGDGVAAVNLSVRPANLPHTVEAMPAIVEPLFSWTIAEGGVPLGSPMPPFKDVLSRTQIWQIITYLQAGLPAVE
jgi:hypothetical protein